MYRKKLVKIAIKAGRSTFLSSSAWAWFQKGIVLTIFCLAVNHLATRDSFPDGESYRFPLEGFLSSIALCILIGIIAELNFNYYRKKHFSKQVDVVTIIKFMATTLGYITLMYIPVNMMLNKIAGGTTEIYFILIGLLITLLVSLVFIGLLYARNIYSLYKFSLKEAEITIESGAKLTKLPYEHIACFYSENKIVYAIQKDGTTLHTDFTLNELEGKINEQLFFRANRQMIVHRDSVQQIEKIENGKLRIRLTALLDKEAMAEINISRYKRKAFMDWFQ